MPGKAAKIELTVTMYETIQQICNSRTLSLSVVERAKAILLGFDKQLNEDIARQLSINRKTVGLWRRRWRDSFSALLALQFSESAAKFRRYIRRGSFRCSKKWIPRKVHSRPDRGNHRRGLRATESVGNPGDHVDRS